MHHGHLEKGTVLFRVPIDWVYFSCTLCTNYKQNKVKQIIENVHTIIFDLPKHV